MICGRVLLYFTHSLELYLLLDPPEHFPVSLFQAVQWQPENMPQLPPVGSTESMCAFLVCGMVHHRIRFLSELLVINEYIC